MAGRREWLGGSIVLFFLLLYTIIAGIVFSFNTLLIYIHRDIHVKLALFELLAALPASIQGLVAPVATWLSFRLGIWQTVAAGTVLATLGVALTGLANNPTVLFITYGGLFSIGTLLIVNPPFYLIDQIYPYNHPRHALATSITACGFPLATLVINPLSKALADAVGWHLTYVILAAVLFISGTAWVIAAVLWSYTPPDDQIDVDGNKEEESVHPEPQVHVSTALKVTICVLWTAASITKCTAYYTPYITMVVQMDTLGIPPSLSWQVMPVIGAAELVSRLVASWLGDFYKGRALYVYALFCTILAVINLLGSMSYNHTHFMLYGAGIGLFGGPIIASLYSCSAEVLYGQQVPLVFSLFRTGIGVACLMGPVIAGGMHDVLGSLHSVFYMYFGMYLFSSIVYIIIILINKYHRPGTQSDKDNLLDDVPISYQTLQPDDATAK